MWKNEIFLLYIQHHHRQTYLKHLPQNSYYKKYSGDILEKRIRFLTLFLLYIVKNLIRFISKAFQSEISIISNEIKPEGTLISTLSPFFLPIKPLAMGVETDIFLSLRFASLSDTII